MRNNYEMDIFRGEIYLIYRSIKENQLVEDKLGVGLSKESEQQVKKEKSKEMLDSKVIEQVKDLETQLRDLKERNKELVMKIAANSIIKKEPLYEDEEMEKLKSQFKGFKHTFQKWKKQFLGKRNDILSTKEIINDNGKFHGEIKNEEYHGLGIFIYDNGDNLEGQFRNGCANGFALFHQNKGNYYEGEFKHDKKNGLGSLFFTDGERYEGEFKNDIQNGRGTHFYQDGSRYEGEYKNGVPTGRGRKFYSSGNILVPLYSVKKQQEGWYHLWMYSQYRYI